MQIEGLQFASLKRVHSYENRICMQKNPKVIWFTTYSVHLCTTSAETAPFQRFWSMPFASKYLWGGHFRWMQPGPHSGTFQKQRGFGADSGTPSPHGLKNQVPHCNLARNCGKSLEIKTTPDGNQAMEMGKLKCLEQLKVQMGLEGPVTPVIWKNKEYIHLDFEGIHIFSTLFPHYFH